MTEDDPLYLLLQSHLQITYIVEKALDAALEYDDPDPADEEDDPNIVDVTGMSVAEIHEHVFGKQA